MHNTGALEMVNCTLSANETSRRGGGLAVSAAGAEPAPQTTLSHVTITGNKGAGTAGGLSATGGGRLEVFGSIVAGNASGRQPDVEVSEGVSMTSSHNIYGDCCNFTWSATDLTDVADPRLGLLKANGGLTKTHALLEQSPAIDLIPAGKCRLALDQRNVIRPQAGRCDAGAFELE